MSENSENNNLVIFSATYPYGNGEPFLGEELPYLLQHFKNIHIIVPDSVAGNKPLTKKLPENVYAHKIIVHAKPIRKILSLFTFGLSFFFDQLKEIRKHATEKNYLQLLKISLGYEFKRIPFTNLLLEYLKKYDLNFSNTLFYSYWCTEFTYALARIKKIHPELKFITRVHGWDIYKERHQPEFLPFRNFIYHSASFVIPISTHGKNYLNDRYGINQNVRLCRLGAHNNLSYPFTKTQRNSNKIRLLSLSFLFHAKNIESLVDALSLTEDEVSWVHIGNGIPDYEPFIKKYATEKLLHKSNIKYEFAGVKSKEEIIAYFKNDNCDFLINVSVSEGLPVSMMEAMSFGIPVIARNVGGISEIVKHGKNGFLMHEFASPKELSETITHCKNLNQNEYLELSENARNTWAQEFDASKNFKAIADLLQSLK